MNELANTESHLPSRLDELAMQAHMFAQNACMNLLQLGRVLSEARPMIPHGEFDGWCRQHAKMSKRTAEQYMQAYAEFGLDTKIAELGTSKVIKLLPMTEDEREKLLSENDVASMSTRQLDEAIKQQRAMLLKEVRAEVKEDMDRIAALGRDALAEKNRLAKENARLERDLQDSKDDIAELQAERDGFRDQLLENESAQARGDAERQPTDTLTPDVFSMAVNSFIGTCCRLPQMGREFSTMRDDDYKRYEESLRVIEKWAESARLALNNVSLKEAIVID